MKSVTRLALAAICCIFVLGKQMAIRAYDGDGCTATSIGIGWGNGGSQNAEDSCNNGDCNGACQGLSNFTDAGDPCHVCTGGDSNGPCTTAVTTFVDSDDYQHWQSFGVCLCYGCGLPLPE